jgi:hypothetical protein
VEPVKEDARRDDPVEGGALDDEPEGETEDRPPAHDEPVESGDLEH